MTATYYTKDGGMTRARVDWDEGEGDSILVAKSDLLNLLIAAQFIETGPPPAAVFTIPAS